jgi:uncharacterized cupin superfamily protein
MSTRPRFIISSADVPEKPPWRYSGSDEELSASRAIGRAAGLVRLGLHIERVPPNYRTSWPHAEEKEEEFVYVLEGEIDAWIDGRLYPMKAGDLAAFPAGTGIAHTFINNGRRDATLLVGGESTKADNRCCFPLNPERRASLAGEWWDDAPVCPLGPHDGLPDARRSSA